MLLNLIYNCLKFLRVNMVSTKIMHKDGIGANLFVGNLDSEVDERVLFDTFSAFGVILDNPLIVSNPKSEYSKGHGFVSFNNFEDADAACNTLDGQYLMNRKIILQYARKQQNKDEFYGNLLERRLAAELKNKGFLP